MHKIILDAGHGINTAGKRSPDGRFREYKFNRIIRDAVAEHLRLRGYNVEILNPEETDLPLPARAARANNMTCQIGLPIQNVAIISIHANAAGNGSQWMKARGWCAYPCKGHTLSDELATCLYKAARKHLPGQRIRTDYTDGDPDFEAQFYLLRNTYAAAVLTDLAQGQIIAVESFRRPDGDLQDVFLQLGCLFAGKAFKRKIPGFDG